MLRQVLRPKASLVHCYRGLFVIRSQTRTGRAESTLPNQPRRLLRMKRRRHVYRRHTMSAMELRVAKRDHMSAVANLGRRTTLRRSSSSLDRRSTIRRHGTMTSVSGMNHTPSPPPASVSPASPPLTADGSAKDFVSASQGELASFR